MSDNGGIPMDVDDNNAPFSGPNPDADRGVSTRPETDSDIDAQELYDEGLAGAAEVDQDETNDSQDVDLPSGFHVEE